jgi:hypothetical protein
LTSTATEGCASTRCALLRPRQRGSPIVHLLHRGAHGSTAKLQLVVAWSVSSGDDVEVRLSRREEARKAAAMAASMQRRSAALVSSVEKTCVMENGASVETLTTSITTHFIVDNIKRGMGHGKMDLPLKIAWLSKRASKLRSSSTSPATMHGVRKYVDT